MDVLRAGRSSSSLSQDTQIADLVARMYAMERYVNSLAGVPAVATNAIYGGQGPWEGQGQGIGLGEGDAGCGCVG